MQIINLTYELIILTDLIYVIHFSLHHSNSLPSILPEVATPQQYSTNCICVCVYISTYLIAKHKTHIPHQSLPYVLFFNKLSLKYNSHTVIYTLQSVSCLYITLYSQVHLANHYFVFLQRPKYKQGWALNIMTDLTDSRQVEITS